MKLKLIARHLRDDIDHVIMEEVEQNLGVLISRMKQEIEENRSEGSNWRFYIVPHKDIYKD